MSRPATIIVVDDQDYMRELLQIWLEVFGYRVLAVSAPAEALEFSRGTALPIDFLVTDLSLGEINGVDLASRIRTLHPEVKVIFMSGYCREEAAIHFPELFIWDAKFLQKPISSEQLHGAVQE